VGKRLLDRDTARLLPSALNGPSGPSPSSDLGLRPRLECDVPSRDERNGEPGAPPSTGGQNMDLVSADVVGGRDDDDETMSIRWR